MKRRQHKWAKDGDRRTCRRCGREIQNVRAVFLVGSPSGRMVGPFHPTCAEWLVWYAIWGLSPGDGDPADDFGTLVPALEEAARTCDD